MQLPGHFVLVHWALLATHKLGPGLKTLCLLFAWLPLLLFPAVVGPRAPPCAAASAALAFGGVPGGSCVLVLLSRIPYASRVVVEVPA